MSAVAIISTYSPSAGFGGPARIQAMRRTIEAAGLPVTHVVIQSRPDRGAVSSADFVRLVERPHGDPVDHIYDDLHLANRASGDAALIRSVAEHLRRRGVSVIVLEQPFLVEMVERVVELINVPVLYSSANIEYRLKLELERFDPKWQRSRRRSEEVRSLEQKAVDLASHVTAICVTDQDALRTEFGCDSTLVPNGTTVADYPYVAARRSHSDQPVDFVTVGSAYWPNVEGFAMVATPSLAFLPPTTRVHVVGSMSTQLFQEPTMRQHESVNAARLVLRGFVEVDELVATLHEARAVLVPIFSGQGSNLKAADALASERPVIMTERAVHGYEDVLADDPDGVTVVDTPREFREAMDAALGGPPESKTVGAARRRALTWEKRLAPLVEVIRDLAVVGS
jgi:hypothetical protein